MSLFWENNAKTQTSQNDAIQPLWRSTPKQQGATVSKPWHLIHLIPGSFSESSHLERLESKRLNFSVLRKIQQDDLTQNFLISVTWPYDKFEIITKLDLTTRELFKKLCPEWRWSTMDMILETGDSREFGRISYWRILQRDSVNLGKAGFVTSCFV